MVGDDGASCKLTRHAGRKQQLGRCSGVRNRSRRTRRRRCRLAPVCSAFRNATDKRRVTEKPTSKWRTRALGRLRSLYIGGAASAPPECRSRAAPRLDNHGSHDRCIDSPVSCHLLVTAMAAAAAVPRETERNAPQCANHGDDVVHCFSAHALLRFLLLLSLLPAVSFVASLYNPKNRDG